MRPRRTLDHLFGDDEIEGILRPRRVLPPVETLPPAVLPTRPRRAIEESVDPSAPFGSSGDPFGATRLRRTQPRDYLADDTAYLRDLENAPQENVGRAEGAWRGFRRGGILGAIGGAISPPRDNRERDEEIGQVKERVGREVALEGVHRAQRREGLQDRLTESQIAENAAQTEARNRPPRPILGRETMEDGTVVQTQLNPETGTFEPAIGSGGGPIILSRPKPVVPERRSGGSPIVEQQPDGTWKTVYAPPEKPEPADFSGPLAAKKFAKASQYWARAEQLEKEAREIVTVTPTPDGEGVVDIAAEARQKQLLAEATKLKERTLILQEQGDALEVKSTRPDRPTKSKAVPTTHSFSISAYIRRNQGATESDAKAFAAREYPGYELAP